MKKLTLLIAVCTLFLAMNAQAQWSSKNKIKGNGNLITETRKTATYDQVKVAGFFDVDLVSGKEGVILLEGEGNLLPHVKIEVEGNVLKIFTDKNSNISTSNGKTIRITVPFEVISAVELVGSGDVVSQHTIKAESFTAKLTGSGDLKLAVDAQSTAIILAGSGDIAITGTTESLMSKLSGSGDLTTTNLKAKIAQVTVAGSGDLTLFCSENLTARVTGSGSIKYKGNPEKRDTNVSGSGSISKI